MAINDTRLWEYLDDVTDLMHRVQAMSQEDIKSPQDRMDIHSALHLLVGFHKKIVGVMPPKLLCLKFSSLGSQCFRGRDHEGPHLSEWGNTWTDESDAASAKAIAKSMKGKTE